MVVSNSSCFEWEPNVPLQNTDCLFNRNHCSSEQSSSSLHVFEDQQPPCAGGKFAQSWWKKKKRKVSSTCVLDVSYKLYSQAHDVLQFLQQECTLSQMPFFSHKGEVGIFELKVTTWLKTASFHVPEIVPSFANCTNINTSHKKTMHHIYTKQNRQRPSIFFATASFTAWCWTSGNFWIYFLGFLAGESWLKFADFPGKTNA